jgi:hypothetical protein
MSLPQETPFFAQLPRSLTACIYANAGGPSSRFWAVEKMKVAIRLTQANTTCGVCLTADCPKCCGRLSQADSREHEFKTRNHGIAPGKAILFLAA